VTTTIDYKYFYWCYLLIDDYLLAGIIFHLFLSFINCSQYSLIYITVLLIAHSILVLASGCIRVFLYPDIKLFIFKIYDLFNSSKIKCFRILRPIFLIVIRIFVRRRIIYMQYIILCVLNTYMCIELINYVLLYASIYLTFLKNLIRIYIE